MIVDTIIVICLAIGLIFNALGVIGILRFPDVYTRLHAETKTTTFGTIFIGLAVVISALSALLGTGEGQYLTLLLHTIIAVIALAFTNATGAHAIARAAYRSGYKPAQAVVDRMKEAKQ
ncbi:cation:proton antiporter [Methanoculleus taiwanensis]|uniref:Cation:proton antiporter n=1 Tax=Methanoculleus taiwanensis TaxID=1550565 RepID=A0A498H0R8_9EURY|nr:monovalent cation/H(+) antiporter subunit G [Methanoculleus taiwanensis]RXE56218.1 cation:proton antiporter [Methanoculleus taiwanensis]